MKRDFLFIILLALLPAGVLGAQEELREIEVRTLCFGYSNKLKQLTLSGDLQGNSQVEVNLEKYLDSNQQRVSLTGDELLVGESGDAGFQSWAKVKVSKSLTEVLLVFFPLEDLKKPYHIVALDDSVKGFPLGSFLIANMSPSALRFIVGETPFQVNPGEVELASELKNVKANGQVSYYAYYQQDNDWKRLSTGFWDVVPRKRNFQIAFGNPKTKNVELRGYEDSFPILKELLLKQQEAE